MGDQFGRIVRASITPKDGSSITKIEGFDMSFDIEKNLEQEPNKGKFKFYNLPEEFRNKLQLKDSDKIVFEAGYKDTVASVFEGNVTHVLSGIEGPDWVTNMEAEEGGKAYRKSFVAKSYGEGTPFKTVIDDIVATFEGLKITPAVTATIANIGKTFPSGLTLDGSSARVLTSILQGVGLTYSIQNGQIQILASGASTDQPMIELDYSSGLVNIPQLGEKKDKATISFQCFVNPQIVPGRKVLLKQPKSARGIYVCHVVKLKGSTFDTEYYNTIEAFIP